MRNEIALQDGIFYVITDDPRIISRFMVAMGEAARSAVLCEEYEEAKTYIDFFLQMKKVYKSTTAPEPPSTGYSEDEFDVLFKTEEEE